MIKYRKSQLSFAQLQINSCIDKAHWLHNVNNILNWEPIRHKFADLHPSNTGRPAYDPVFMFKVLLLEQWFNLSDPQAEAQINDRISFKVFLGMDITETGPDETTICNFRNYIGSLGLTEELFEEISRQFEEKGLVIKIGTLIDASWGVKGKERNKKYCYGYKLHVGVDQDSGIIRQAEITEARINDHEVFDELISGDEQAVYADKAYADKLRNKKLSKIRAQVERPFGIIKSKWGYNRARYLGLFRNRVHLLLIFIAYNIRRAYSLSVI